MALCSSLGGQGGVQLHKVGHELGFQSWPLQLEGGGQEAILYCETLSKQHDGLGLHGIKGDTLNSPH